MTSFFAQMMEPGGGVLLLPFVRVVIGMLMVLTMIDAIAGVARMHMVILSFLSAGLLISLAFFESEYKKQQQRAYGSSNSSGAPQQAPASSAGTKTD